MKKIRHFTSPYTPSEVRKLAHLWFIKISEILLTSTFKISDILLKLIELKKINDKLYSLKKKFNTSVENIFNFDSINNSFIDCIKVCRNDVKTIGSKHKSTKFRCFWPKCQFKAKRECDLKGHQLIHSNEQKYKCNECMKMFKQISGLSI